MSDESSGPPNWGGPPPQDDLKDQTAIPDQYTGTDQPRQSVYPQAYPQKPFKPPGPWGVWATLGWMALMVGAMLVASFAAIFPFALYIKLTDNPSFSRLMSILENAVENGDYIWINFVVALPFVAAVMAVALIMRQGYPVREYLAIRNTRAHNWILWPLALAAFSMGADALLYVLDIDPVAQWMTAVYNSATCFSCLMFAVVLIAPLIEEFIFRGFVFTGIQARLGSFWAVIFSSVPWAIIHLQYQEWYFIVLIFMLGVLFGVARWRTNSVLVPISMHMFQNALASVQMYFVS